MNLKLLPLLFALSFQLPVARAAEWPPAFETYEQAAFLQPNADEPIYQLRAFARSSGRGLEMKERWEQKATAGDAWRYRVMIGNCVLAAWDAAAERVELQKATELAPEEPAVWLALGRFESAQEKPGARAALEKACALAGAAGDPGEPLVALVNDHLARGRKAEALAVLDRDSATVQDAGCWARLMETWAKAALAEGRLGEVLGRLEAAPGAATAVARASLYAGVRDFSMADAVLQKARQTWPDDALLRARALTVAKAEKDASECVRLMREQSAAQKTPAGWCDLLIALLKVGAADEAGRLLEAHRAELAAQAARWRGSLAEIVQLGLAPRAEAALAAAPELWEAVFARGELAILQAQYPQAQKVLWSLFDARFDGQAPSSLARERFAQPAGLGPSYGFPSLLLADRYSRASTCYYATSELFRQPESRTQYSPHVAAHTVQDARDFALLELGVIAVETKGEQALAVELPARFARLPEQERLLAWMILGTGEAIVNAVETYSSGTERTPPVDKFCIEQLRKVETAPDSKGELAKRAQALPGRLTATAPAAAPELVYRPVKTAGPVRVRKNDPYRESYDEFLKGNFEKMTSLYAAAARGFGESNESLVYNTMSFALCLTKFKSDPPRLAEAGAAVLTCLLPPTYQRPKVDRPPNVEDLWSTGQPGNSYGTHFPTMGSPLRVYNLPKEEQARLAYPPISLLTASESTVLWTVFGETRDPAVWAALKQRLDAPVEGAAPAQEFTGRVARIYLGWWNREYDDSLARMQKLLEESSDDGVRLGLAVMLQRLDRRPEAIALIDQMKRPYPAFARLQQCWSLRMAAEAKDQAAVAAQLPGLADEPLEPDERRELAKALQTAGFKDEAERLRIPLRARIEREEDWRRISEALNDFESAPDRAPAQALARRVLSISPRLAKTESLNSRYRGRARMVIRETGDAYPSELRDRAAAGGDPIENQWRLAEVAVTGEESQAAWRRLLELDPSNVLAAELLLNQAPKQDPQRWQMFGAALAAKPKETMLIRSGEIAEAYLSAGKVPELVKLISTTNFPGPVARQGGSEDGQWRRLATPLAQAGEHDAAIAVLRKAISLSDGPAIELRRLLALELDRAHRDNELRKELTAMLAPEAAPPAMPFLLQEARGRMRSVNEGSVPAMDLDPAILALAQKTGATSEARALLAKAAAESPAARKNWLLLRALEGETAVLEELRPLIDGPLRREEEPWLMALAQVLCDWPDGAESAQRLVAKIDPLLPRDHDRNGAVRADLARLAFRCGAQPVAQKLFREARETALAEALGIHSGQPLRHVAEVAFECGDTASLAECGAAWRKWLAGFKPDYVTTEESSRFLALFLESDQTAEAEKNMEALRGQPGPKQLPEFEQRMRLYVDELHARSGDFTNCAPIVWVDPDRTTEQAATLVWDFALHQADDQEGRFATTDQGLAKFAGACDVELFFGAKPDDLHSLARIPKGGARGEWKGALPAPLGWVRATFTSGGKAIEGPLFPVGTGRNLLRDAAAPGSTFPPGVPSPVRGGPSPGGAAIRHRDPNTAFASAGPIKARRVEVQPGHNYVLSGWLRAVGWQPLILSWRYLDRDGRELGTGRTQDAARDQRYWNYHWVGLQWTSDRGDDRIPEGTAFIEPLIGGGTDGFDLAAFSLTEIPVAK